MMAKFNTNVSTLTSRIISLNQVYYTHIFTNKKTHLSSITGNCKLNHILITIIIGEYSFLLYAGFKILLRIISN